DVVVLPGSPPNQDFETAASTLGTPPTNYGFAIGDFTGWTPGGSPTIETSGWPDGPYARRPGGTSLVSAASTLASTTQCGSIPISGLTTFADQVNLDVLSGSGYRTTTRVLAGIGADGWATYRFRLIAWAGQSIKLKLTRSGSGAAGVATRRRRGLRGRRA